MNHTSRTTRLRLCSAVHCSQCYTYWPWRLCVICAAPVVLYGSSEAFFGINHRRPGEDPAYAVMPSMAFVEFLPVDSTGAPLEGAQPLLGTDVKVTHSAARWRQFAHNSHVCRRLKIQFWQEYCENTEWKGLCSGCLVRWANLAIKLPLVLLIGTYWSDFFQRNILMSFVLNYIVDDSIRKISANDSYSPIGWCSVYAFTSAAVQLKLV